MKVFSIQSQLAVEMRYSSNNLQSHFSIIPCELS